MKDFLAVGIGGFLGSVSRYYLGGWILHLTAAQRFPYGTFAVNLIGCFMIGLIGGLIEHLHLFSPQMRIFLITGLLGGFTTFSAFGFETLYLIRSGQNTVALFYIFLSIIFGLFAIWMGQKLAFSL